MQESDYLWLLARTFVVVRRGYITSHIAPIYDELKTALTNASGVQIDSTTPGDDGILDLFRPRPEADDAPVRSVDQPKASRRK